LVQVAPPFVETTNTRVVAMNTLLLFEGSHTIAPIEENAEVTTQAVKLQFHLPFFEHPGTWES
jgi:hypothetical protein